MAVPFKLHEPLQDRRSLAPDLAASVRYVECIAGKFAGGLLRVSAYQSQDTFLIVAYLALCILAPIP